MHNATELPVSASSMVLAAVDTVTALRAGSIASLPAGADLTSPSRFAGRESGTLYCVAVQCIIQSQCFAFRRPFSPAPSSTLRVLNCRSLSGRRGEGALQHCLCYAPFERPSLTFSFFLFYKKVHLLNPLVSRSNHTATQQMAVIQPSQRHQWCWTRNTNTRRHQQGWSILVSKKN